MNETNVVFKAMVITDFEVALEVFNMAKKHITKRIVGGHFW